jgi:hypothetical protein
MEARRGEELQTRVIADALVAGVVAGLVTSMAICVRNRSPCASRYEDNQLAVDDDGHCVGSAEG